MLLSAYFGAMAVGLVIGLIQARWMAPAEMGRFAFCFTIITIGGLFFELGVFPAGARALALAPDPETEQRILGALIAATLVIAAAFALFIAAIAAPIDLIFGKDVRWLLIGTAALAFFQPFQALIEQSCQGLNRIRRLSVFQLLASGAYLVILIGLVISSRLSAGSALGAWLAGIGFASVWLLVGMRPRFDAVPEYVKLVLGEARRYGLNLSVARITGVASARFDTLVIGYFLTDIAALGLYAFAQKVSAPIVSVSRALAITRFRAFARLDRVPARVNLGNAAILLASAAALVLAGPMILRFAFPKYADAAPLLLPFAALNLFAGLFQPYNMFLTSHGRGGDVRNIALAVVGAAIIGLVLTVPRFHILGAAWTGAGTMALDYALHLYYYQRFRRTLEETLNAGQSDKRD